MTTQRETTLTDPALAVWLLSIEEHSTLEYQSFTEHLKTIDNQQVAFEARVPLGTRVRGIGMTHLMGQEGILLRHTELQWRDLGENRPTIQFFDVFEPHYVHPRLLEYWLNDQWMSYQNVIDTQDWRAT